jgi:hypothetical protein
VLWLVSTGPVSSEDSSALPEEALPLAELPKRPKPLLEWGEPFLGTGTLKRGFTIPTGATWQPAFLSWGVLRTALHGIDQRGAEPSAQWANRLNLFGQLSLTPTERIVIGLGPLDENGEFTGHIFAPEREQGGVDAVNAEVRSLYFEGDFGELFPFLDPRDTRGLDLGFAVGRTPLFFQDGMLIADAVDSVGIVRNTLRPPGTANVRLTAAYGWGNLHRGGNNALDATAQLFGLFAEIDVPWSQLALDTAYVSAREETGDALYIGLSGSQVIGGRLNSVLRVIASQPVDTESDSVDRGVLVFGEFSWVPLGTHDNIYVNAFGAIGHFTPAARAPDIGGPLGRAGILFEGAGVGAYAPVLSNQARDVVGGAIGYQRFIDARTQIVVETAARYETGDRTLAGGIGLRLQRALGRRFIVRVDAFGLTQESETFRYGGRGEILVKF